MTDTQQNTKKHNIFLFFVSLTLIAYISRIAELFPALMVYRINMLLFTITFILFFTSGVRRNIPWENNKELKLTLCFLGLAIASFPFSVWPSNALQTIKDILLINTTVFLFCQSTIQTEKQLYTIIKTIIFSCALLLFGIFFKPIIVEGHRVTTTMTYDPNDIALLFTFIFPLVLSLFITSKFIGKIVTSLILLTLIIGIIKTGSRGGMLAFGVSMILVFFSSGLKLKIFYKLMVISIVILFVLSPMGQPLRERFDKLTSGTDYNITNTESGAGGRLAIWTSGLTLLKNNFFLGVGPGNSSTAMGLQHGDFGWKTMHNSYLQAAVEMGGAGFLIFIAMLHTILRNCNIAIKNYSTLPHKMNNSLVSLTSSLRIGLFGYMTAAFFLSQAFSIIIPLALALSSGLKKISSSNHNPQHN